MTRGLINDGIIEQVHLKSEPVDLSAIPEQHRTRFFNPGELDAFAHLLKGKKRIIEIGCQNGRTAKAILSNRPDIELYIGIDVPPESALVGTVQRNETPERAGELALDDPRFVLLLAKNGSADLRQILPFCEAVFIDGDHSYEAVRRDHLLAASLVKPGGVIVHHDYHSLGTVGVREALVDLASKGWEFKHVAGTWLVYSDVR